MSVHCTIENLLFSKTLHVKGIVIAAHQPFCWLECGKKQSLKLPNNSVVLTDGGSGPPPPPSKKRQNKDYEVFSRNNNQSSNGLMGGCFCMVICQEVFLMSAPPPQSNYDIIVLIPLAFLLRPAIGLLDIQKSKKGFGL